MSTAKGKPIKVHEFSAASFTREGEHILCAVIIGPDCDDPTRRTLHLRSNAAAVELLRIMPKETVQMILDHQEALLDNFRKMILERGVA